MEWRSNPWAGVFAATLCPFHDDEACARWLMGRFPSPKVRRPLRDLGRETVEKIRKGLEAIGYAKERAAAAI